MGLDKFSAALDLLKGFNVNLYVGEDIYKGKLIGVEADHVVMETEDKYIFYYSIDKIQAITKNTRQFQPEEPTSEFQKTKSLSELLQSFQHSWVTILCINKQKFSGVLSDIDTDFATLINGEERILIKLTHISNILKGFIKIEELKKETTKEKAENTNDGKKDEEKKNEKEEKEEVTCLTSGKKSESKTKQSVKVTAVSSEKKAKAAAHDEKPEMKQEAVATAEMAEPNDTMVWSQPIKIEEPVAPIMDLHLTKDKKQQSSADASLITKSEMKKPSNEMKQKEKKQEEPSMSKPQAIKPVKEMKQEKEMKSVKEMKSTKDAAAVKSEIKPVYTSPTPKKENKHVKSQDTVTTSKPVLTQNAAPKNTEEKKYGGFANDTKNVWKQKDQEKRAFRFAGEPVSREAERPFPFAGWPNRNKRTFRF